MGIGLKKEKEKEMGEEIEEEVFFISICERRERIFYLHELLNNRLP